MVHDFRVHALEYNHSLSFITITNTKFLFKLLHEKIAIIAIIAQKLTFFKLTDTNFVNFVYCKTIKNIHETP